MKRLYLERSDIPATGQRVRLDSFAYRHDPVAALNRRFEDVAVTTDIGMLPAWYFPGSLPTWVITVHGKGSSRAEALRLLNALDNSGFPVLAITYRNDEGVAPSKSGRYDYGRTEWQDLEAAVRYARDAGARDVVLVGYSMGGGIVMSFMQRSPLASDMRALILDSPMLDFEATIDFSAGRKGLPGALTAAAKAITALRYGVKWHELDYLRDLDYLRVPVLILHGDDDTTVPLSTSEKLAAARPDIVQLRITPGATHVRSWNVDPGGYRKAVRDFLAGFGGAR